MSTSHPDPAMSPDDVPIELRMLAVAAINANDLLPEDDQDQTPDHILAAVLPEFERQVRERIVADLAAERQKVGDNEGVTLQADYVIGGVCRGLSDAIEIVQGKR